VARYGASIAAPTEGRSPVKRRVRVPCSSRRRPVDLERLWTTKLYNEALLLGHMGCLDDQGNVFCRECGLELERPDGWKLKLVCACGWQLEDL
jgi:hypothetical protein